MKPGRGWRHATNTKTVCTRIVLVLAALLLAAFVKPGGARAGEIVVGHDVNTLGTFVAGPQEETFAVNVATFLTAGRTTKNLLLFESAAGDGTRDFAAGVLNALQGARFSVTVTTDYTTPFTSFDAIFVAQGFPVPTFLDNAVLIQYVDSGGGVYVAGGVGPVASTEAAGWSTFLNHYGLALDSSGYNGLTNVPITSSHPIFAGVTALGCGNGQSIIDLATNPNAQIVQFAEVGGAMQGVYAVVTVAPPASTVTPTNTPTNTLTVTPTSTPTNTPTQTPTVTPTSAPTVPASPSDCCQPPLSACSKPINGGCPAGSFVVPDAECAGFFGCQVHTPTNTPTNTSQPTNTSTNTPIPTDTPTMTPIPTNSPTNSPLPTSTPTNTPLPANTPTNTPPLTNTPTNTPLPTETPTQTPTVSASACLNAQFAVQQAVLAGGPYRNHGALVSTAARAVNRAVTDGDITEACAGCIISQFARGIPIDQQTPCEAPPSGFTGTPGQTPARETPSTTSIPATVRRSETPMVSASPPKPPPTPTETLSGGCPCAGPPEGGAWHNHGEYVRCVAQATRELERSEMLTQAQHWALAGASHSSCGRGGTTRCCTATGTTVRCQITVPDKCATRGGSDIGQGSCVPNPCGAL